MGDLKKVGPSEDDGVVQAASISRDGLSLSLSLFPASHFLPTD